MPAPTPAHSLALLGASNLHRGFPSLLRVVRRRFGSPVEIFAAKGHGRSYGITSGAMGLFLPGIRTCGLYEAIAARQARPLTALVADAGNDLLYGVAPRTLSDWVAEAFDRLQELGAQVGYLPPPVQTIRRISERQYLTVRTLLYSRCRIGFARMMDMVEDLHVRLLDQARQRGIAVLEQGSAWYGLDPVHVQWWRYEPAWNAIIAPLAPASDRGPNLFGPGRLWLARLRPRAWGMNGRTFQTPQPVARLPDGTVLHFY